MILNFYFEYNIGGVINFTKTSDLESAMKSIEGIFFNDSKCYGKYLIGIWYLKLSFLN